MDLVNGPWPVDDEQKATSDADEAEASPLGVIHHPSVYRGNPRFLPLPDWEDDDPPREYTPEQSAALERMCDMLAEGLRMPICPPAKLRLVGGPISPPASGNTE